MRFYRMSGLDAEQLGELEEMVSELMAEPWVKRTGRMRELTFREALIVTSGYMRNNITEEVWADIFGVDQSTISRCITLLTPLIEQATADKTTGHGSLIITNLTGRVTFVSEPVPGTQHDMAKLKGEECESILKRAGGVIGDKGFIGTDYITTPVRKPEDRELYIREHDYNNQISSLRAPVERAVANLKTWRILFTDYRRPLKTFLSSFRAAIGLYFFKESFA